MGKPSTKHELETLTQETNTMKTITLTTALMTNVITALIVGVALFITGYFTSVNIYQDARADVVTDIKAVKAVSKD